MQSVYNKLTTNPQKLFAAVVTLVLLATTLWLHPTVKASFFSSSQEQRLQEFIEQIKREDSVDAQDFWQFRASYSPGYFTINPNAIELGQTYILKALPETKTLLLEYHSPKLISRDYLVEANVGTEIINNYPIDGEVIWQTENTLIYENNNQWQLIFLKPTAEMQKANGFFNYTSRERKLMENRQWLNETTIYQ